MFPSAGWHVPTSRLPACRSTLHPSPSGRVCTGQSKPGGLLRGQSHGHGNEERRAAVCLLHIAPMPPPPPPWVRMVDGVLRALWVWLGGCTCQSFGTVQCEVPGGRVLVPLPTGRGPREYVLGWGWGQGPLGCQAGMISAPPPPPTPTQGAGLGFQGH